MVGKFFDNSVAADVARNRNEGGGNADLRSFSRTLYTSLERIGSLLCSQAT
jgi:hypothetical protein